MIVESAAIGSALSESPMDWTLSGEANRYIENALIARTGVCRDDRRNCREA